MTNIYATAGRAMRREEKDSITNALSKNHACYILITCDAPTEDGEMQVHLTYEGDPKVATYLLEGAQSVILENQDLPPCHSSPKVIKLP